MAAACRSPPARDEPLRAAAASVGQGAASCKEARARQKAAEEEKTRDESELKSLEPVPRPQFPGPGGNEGANLDGEDFTFNDLRMLESRAAAFKRYPRTPSPETRARCAEGGAAAPDPGDAETGYGVRRRRPRPGSGSSATRSLRPSGDRRSDAVVYSSPGSGEADAYRRSAWVRTRRPAPQLGRRPAAAGSTPVPARRSRGSKLRRRTGRRRRPPTIPATRTTTIPATSARVRPGRRCGRGAATPGIFDWQTSDAVVTARSRPGLESVSTASGWSSDYREYADPGLESRFRSKRSPTVGSRA